MVGGKRTRLVCVRRVANEAGVWLELRVGGGEGGNESRATMQGGSPCAAQ